MTARDIQESSTASAHHLMQDTPGQMLAQPSQPLWGIVWRQWPQLRPSRLACGCRLAPVSALWEAQPPPWQPATPDSSLQAKAGHSPDTQVCLSRVRASSAAHAASGCSILGGTRSAKDLPHPAAVCRRGARQLKQARGSGHSQPWAMHQVQRPGQKHER